MGDGADQALERAATESDMYENSRDASWEEQYDAGLIDETGAVIGNPGSFPAIPLSGRIDPGLLDFLF